MHQMFSAGERSGLQAVNLTTKTCLLQTQAVIIAAECGLILSCWNIQGLLWKKMLSGWNVCCFKICTYVSTLIDPVYMCKLPVPLALIHFLTNRDAGFKHWVQPASWMVPPLCSPASIFFQIFEVILPRFLPLSKRKRLFCNDPDEGHKLKRFGQLIKFFHSASSVAGVFMPPVI